jgi:hypothetical protein
VRMAHAGDQGPVLGRHRCIHAGNGGQQVASERAGVGHELFGGMALADRLGHNLGLSRPVAVDGGLAGVGPLGQGIHAQAVVAHLQDELQRGIQDGLFTSLGAGTTGPALRV